MARLHAAQAKAIENEKISSNDRKIESYIQQYGNIVYDSVISGETEWQIFYNLSELRTGIISWYDFKENASVLEVDAGFGALTGCLCQRCAHVTVTERCEYRARAITKRYKDKENLDVYVGDIEDMEFGEAFDYIVLVGTLEGIAGGASDIYVYGEYLRQFQKHLKLDGKILFAVENRFGLKYFCGAPEPHTNRAFDGLNHYRKGTVGYSFSHKEVEEIVRLAGMTRYKFYYPLPDYKLPQLIYTDSHRPEKNLSERLLPYYVRKDTLVASEQELYNDVIDNGVFPFFANSFLVECSKEQALSDVVYAAVSTDRGKERSFATVIYEDGRVSKKPLYLEGIASARLLYENMQDLERHGIPIVKHTLDVEGNLTMPFISWQTLSNAIKEIMPKQQALFLEILDQIYKNVLCSSEKVHKEHNALLPRAIQGKESQEAEYIRGLDFGPVLKKAYIELIPLNCFYNKETGEYLYFDQEFVRENYPAKYVLFRAIHYIYCFTPDAERYYPKQKLLEKYDMVETWDIFLQEEERFLTEVRNHKRYQQFYQWTRLDWKRIDENPTRLMSEEEKIANYQVSDKMKKIWKLELGILDEIARICKKYQLTYFLVHGSLLGAVRHKGFIPWDDDLDIAMPRKDYDKFLQVASDELTTPLSLCTPASQKDVFWGGFSRIRNEASTGMETRDLNHEGNHGIWVDILPLDVCTMDEELFEKKKDRIRHYQRLLYAKIYGKEFEKYKDLKPWAWRWYRSLAVFYSRDRLWNKLDKTMRSYTEEESENVAFFSAYDKHRRLNAKDFASTVMLEFEGRRVPAPMGYEKYLFQSMGRDYMKYPPEGERKPNHRGIFDPERAYGDYQKLLRETFVGATGKKIILFGAGMMFEDYMKKYGDKYQPTFLVDNDESKWGRMRMGIEVKQPEAILEIPVHRRHLIICSYYYKEIQAQLEQMGITDYHVYVQNVDWIVEAER